MKPGFRFVSIAMAAFAGQLHAQSTWNGTTSNSWGTSSNWSPQEDPASGADIIIADSTGSANVLVLDANRAIGNFQFGTTGTRNTNFTVRSTSGHTLDFADGLTASGPLNGVRLTLNGNLSLSADQTWNIGGEIGAHNGDRGVFIREIVEANGSTPGGAAAIGSVVMDGDLTKTGTGQLVLAATTVSGAGNFIVNEGALKLNAGVNRLLTVGGSGNITLNNDAQLFLSRNSGTMAVTRDIILNNTAAMVWGGGGTASNNTVDSTIAWNGTSHTLNLPVNNTNYNSTGAWTGAATVNRTGSAILGVGGDLSGFTGTLNIQGGTTNLTGPEMFGGNLDVSGGTLNVAGNIAGNVSISGGTANLNGATVGSSLTLGAGAQLSGEITSTGNMSLDGVQISANPLTTGSLGTLGDLSLSGTNTVAFSPTPASAAPFTILSYGGDLTGGLGNLALSGAADFRSPTFDHDSVAKVITLAVGSESRTWKGGADWDINTSANWQEGDERYFQLDQVAFTDTGAGSVALVGALTPASITINNSAGNDYTFTAAAGSSIGGSTGIVMSGDGNVTLGGANTYTGGVTINGGTLFLTHNQALGAIGNLVTIADGAALDLNGAPTNSRDYQAVIAGSGVGGTGAIVNTGANRQNGFASIKLAADATIGGTGRWDLRPSVAGAGVLDLDGHTLTKTGSGIIALVNSVFTSDGTFLVNEGELRYTRNSTGTTSGLVSLAPGTTFTFENHSSGDFGWDLAVDDATVRNMGAATVTVVSDVVLTNAATFLINPAPFVVDGNLTGSGSLIKEGGQMLTLLGDANHSGGTTVSAGTLRIGNGGTSGSLGGTITNAGTLIFDRSDASTFDGVISGAGAIQKAGDGTLTVTGANDYTGTLTINGGTVRLGGADDRLSVVSIANLANTAGASLDLNGFRQELRGLSGGGDTGGVVTNSGAGSSVLTLRPVGGDTPTFSGVIAGDVRLEIVGDKISPAFGSPRQRLAGTANTFTGGILIDGATLLARQDGSLGEVPAVFDPANITLQNNGTLLNEAFDNALTLHANRGITLGDGGGAFVAGFGGNVTIQGQISGAAGNDLWILQNNGTVIFTGDNTYAGETKIEGPGSNGIGRLSIGDGGTSGSLGSGNVVNDGQLTLNRSDAYLYSGEITGLGTLTQAGTGTTTLTGMHTYTGATTISAGTLELAGGGGLGDTAVSVQALGTLAGSGVIVGNVSVGGTLAPGNSTGTLDFAGNLSFSNGSIYDFEYTGGGTAADLSLVGGTLDLSGNIVLNLTDLGSYTLGDKFTLFAYESLTGDGLLGGHAEGDVFTANGGDWRILYADASAGINGGVISGDTGSGFITITAIPEPSAALLLALASALLARRRRA